MENKQLNEKESLELIAQMIRNTQQRLEKSNGLPFLIWGYVTVLASVAVWYFFSTTGNPQWNFLWLAIPVIGYPMMMLALKKEKNLPTTYIDKVISYVWIAFGVAGFIVPISTFFIQPLLPILFIVVLLMGIGTAITGMVIKFKPIAIAGFVGMFLSLLCLIVKGYEVILVFAAIFIVMMVIPGHILYWKGRK